MSHSNSITDPEILRENPMAALGTEGSHLIHRERAFGFWLYLMSDAVIFALLFANYGVLLRGVADGPVPHEVFELSRAAQETALLLISSLTFGMASIAALSGDRGKASLFLFVTFCLGGGFLALEMLEFSALINNGASPQVSGFLSGFFALVGTHGLHVGVGMIMLVVMMIQLQTKGLSEPVLSRLYRVGLFWHFLDVIWIGIFSFVYLPGVMQ